MSSDSWRTLGTFSSNGNRYRIQKEEPEAAGCGCIILLIVIFCFFGAFAEYDDNDFQKYEYLNRAVDGGRKLVIDWQKRNWHPRGFTDDAGDVGSEPTFTVTAYTPELPPEKLAGYLGDGVFEVIVVTNTKLTSKRGDNASIDESFYVKIRSPYRHGWLYRTLIGDDWELIEGVELDKKPSLDEINRIIQTWSKNK